MQMKDRVLAGVLSCMLCVGFVGCGEPIESVDEAVDVILPVITETTVTTAETTVTTTVTEPHWDVNTEPIGENGVVIANVPHITQFDSYLTACESLATVSVLQYYGMNMSPERFLEHVLPIADYPEKQEDGELHAESPWDYFIGDPMREDAFGCYSTAIEKGVNKIKKGLAIALKGESLESLCSDYIDKGQPVVIWATMYMAPSYVLFDWIVPSGETYSFISPEHALVLIGYDDNHYYFSDSLQYDAQHAYNKEAVETAYEALFEQAVVIDPYVLPEVQRFWFKKDAEEEE